MLWRKTCQAISVQDTVLQKWQNFATATAELCRRSGRTMPPQRQNYAAEVAEPCRKTEKHENNGQMAKNTIKGT